MNIVGDCSSFTGFAIDLEKKEIVVINSLSNCGTLVDSEQVNVALRQMSPYYLEYNMHTLLTKLGEVVDDPLEADVVFSRDYQSDNDKQKIVRPYDVAALVSYVNMKKVD